MLREVKNKRVHCFLDDHFLKQGEYKKWRKTGELREHCFYIDGERHGEFKRWNRNGQLSCHCFFVNGEFTMFDIIPYPVTPDDYVYFVLKYNMQLLPVEKVC